MSSHGRGSRMAKGFDAVQVVSEMNPAAAARQDKAVCPSAAAARVCGFAMSWLVAKLRKKIKVSKVEKIKVKRKIPTRALPLFF